MTIRGEVLSRIVLGAVLCLGAMSSAAYAQETNCTDGKDNDGDAVFDCGDSDCKDEAVCQADGNAENSNARCSDWIDNDKNGFTDCDDVRCQEANITACKGSWTGKGTSARVSNGGNSQQNSSRVPDDIPDLSDGASVEDLIGRGGDNDGERNNVLCSDGIDNDNDGRTDCADFGCRFDRQVTVCQGDPDFRFSVVARVEQTNEFEYPGKDDNPDNPKVRQNAAFNALQLRAFGPLPFIQDSFFLLSMRAERSPRLSFAMFQVPIGKKGHYLNINSGQGGLSTELVRSAHKRLLVEPAFYVYSAFEQGNGAAAEVGGPIDASGKFIFRTYVAGGSGRFNGNVGGGFFNDDDRNFTYSVGGQVHANLIGYYSRWDSPLLYTPVPLTLSTAFGVKYDQRAQERFTAFNGNMVFRFRRLVMLAEGYFKREFDFELNQYSYNVQAGFLLWPKRLLLAADYGEFLSPDDLPDPVPEDLARQLQETQWRVAAHVFLWKNLLQGIVLYTDRRVDPRPGQDEDQITRSLDFIAQYRF